MAKQDDVQRLSRRQREVAALVAEGLTNREIANRLFISERTAEGHVESIRNKLGFNSRVQIAAWAVQPGALDVVARPPRDPVPPPAPAVAAPRNRDRLAVWSAALGIAIVVAGLLAGSLLVLSRWPQTPQQATVWTIAGTGISGASTNGRPAKQSLLDYPSGIAVDASGNLYFADGSSRIRHVANGIVDTLAGTGEGGFDKDGTGALSARLDMQWNNDAGAYIGLAVDPRIKVANSGGGVYFIANGVVRTVSNRVLVTVAGAAGQSQNGFGGDGGPATSAVLNFPSAVAMALNGELFIADTLNDRIRKVDANNVITTYAGTGVEGYSGDGGPATSAQLSGPKGVIMGTDGYLYIADTGNHRIRRVDSEGKITTYAGTGIPGSAGDGNKANFAQLRTPIGMAFDSGGNLYVADSGSNRVRRIDPNGVITTALGTGAAGWNGDDRLPNDTMLHWPKGIAIGHDNTGDILFVADSGNNRIRAVRLLT